MANQDWIQNFFYGGFSDDKFLGIKNSFQYGKGVEIRESPNSLQLAHAVEKISASVVDTPINAMVTISTTGDVIMFGNNGKIFRKANGGDTVVNCYTDTGASAILNATEYNDYLYWATAGNLHRIAIADINADWTGDVTEDYKAFTNANANAHPMIEIANNLYIGDGSYLSELDSFGVFTADKIIIFADEEIRALTWNGKLCRIYSRKSNKVDYGAQYFWNGISTEYNDRIIWNGLTIHTAFNKDGYDYVIAGKRPFIFVTSGYQRIPIRPLPMISRGDSCFIAPNAITLYENLLVIGSCQSGTNTMGRGAWTLGRLNKNYPEVINFDYPTSNDNVTDKVYCVHQGNGELFMSWGNVGGTVFGIDKVNTSKYRTTGELVSVVLYGNRAHDTKENMQTAISFKELAAGEKLQLYIRKNLASVWPDDPEVEVDYTETADRGISFKFKEIANEIGDWNFLETKIVITAGTSQLTTPQLANIGITFDPNIDTNQDVGQD